MKVSKLPPGYKPFPRFTRPAHIKTDTHYIFTTKKYVAEVVYHSSMFYAPEFYKVTVKHLDGKQIWSGGDAIFLDTLFLTDFISDEYERMILTRVNSTESSSHLQIILIDLKTGKEELLTPEGAFYSAGHFISFDGVYYSDSKAVHCIDYSNNRSFVLTEVLKKHFQDIKTWGTCPANNCILVISKDRENNVALFDLRKEEVIEQATLHWKEADQVSIQVGCVLDKNCTTVTASYSNRTASGTLIYSGIEYFQVDF
jgi:hypothetical protein